MNDGKYFLRERDGCTITTDPEALDRKAVFQFLTEARWWSDLNPGSLDRAIQNSICFSLLEANSQIGWARVITDSVTYAYLCDVFITENRRGQGLGSWLVRSVLEHPELKHLKRISLITHDLQAFYIKLGFHFMELPKNYMECLRFATSSGVTDHMN